MGNMPLLLARMGCGEGLLDVQKNGEVGSKEMKKEGRGNRKEKKREREREMEGREREREGKERDGKRERTGKTEEKGKSLRYGALLFSVLLVQWKLKSVWVCITRRSPAMPIK